MEYVITAGIIAAVVILILICILSTWRKVPADKAAIVTGLGKAKVITGGGVIVIPVSYTHLFVLRSEMSQRSSPTRQMVSPDAVVQVRRGGSPPRSPSLGTTSRAWAQPWAMREASIW